MVARTDIRRTKLNRILSGSSPRVLELCSGCGGLALGLQEAGFELTGHIEADAAAAANYARNFQQTKPAAAFEWARPRNMEQMNIRKLVKELCLDSAPDKAFDVLAAGLPCQAYSRIGRSKLRSIAGIDEAYRIDSRAVLYKRFLTYVDACQPVAIVMENVPDILNFGGDNIAERICEQLNSRGYAAIYGLLNSVHFGVPQLRSRFFLMAIDRSLGLQPSFPKPTHAYELPAGYHIPKDILRAHSHATRHLVQPEEQVNGLDEAVSTYAALSDLPYITEHFRDPAAMQKRRVTDALPYRKSKGLTSYQHKMRNWPSFATKARVTGNKVRVTPRDFEIFKRMSRGAEYPEALRKAEALFEERLESEARRPRRNSAKWLRLKKNCVPPYNPKKFKGRWWKLKPDLPSRTLTAHMGKDTYSHIHWDSRQKRMISVREAARLQSFPDGFIFQGGMSSAFQQIGNAVPPLLGKAIADELYAILIGASCGIRQEQISSHSLANG